MREGSVKKNLRYHGDCIEHDQVKIGDQKTKAHKYDMINGFVFLTLHSYQAKHTRRNRQCTNPWRKSNNRISYVDS